MNDKTIGQLFENVSLLPNESFDLLLALVVLLRNILVDVEDHDPAYRETHGNIFITKCDVLGNLSVLLETYCYNTENGNVEKGIQVAYINDKYCYKCSKYIQT